MAHLDESSGYQVGSQAEIETTVADAVMNYLRSQKEVVKVVPDGVSLEVFERLPPKALITVHDARGWDCGSHVFCPHDKVVKPDDTVDNVARVVTFLPGGESKQACLGAHRGQWGCSPRVLLSLAHHLRDQLGQRSRRALWRRRAAPRDGIE